jgi:WD40 repeat protein
LKKEKPSSILKEHINKVYWVKMSDDGKFMLSGGEDGRVLVWDMNKMALFKTI